MFVKYSNICNLPKDTITYAINGVTYNTYEEADAVSEGSLVDIVNLNDADFHIRNIGVNSNKTEYLGVVDESERVSFETWKTNNPVEDIVEITDLAPYKKYINFGLNILNPSMELDERYNTSQKIRLRNDLKTSLQDNPDFISDNSKLIQMIFYTLNLVLTPEQKLLVGNLFAANTYFDINLIAEKDKIFARMETTNTKINEYKTKLI